MGIEELVEILVYAAAMESYGLNPSTVINLVSSNNQLVTAGAIDTGAGRMVVKVPGVVETVDDLISMPIKSLMVLLLNLRYSYRKTSIQGAGQLVSC